MNKKISLLLPSPEYTSPFWFPSPNLGEGLRVRYWKRLGYQAGQSLVEILLAMGLAAVLLPALLTGLVTTREGKAQQNQRLQASGLLKEAEEAIRSVREKGWSNIVPTGTYHPVQTGSTWSLAANSEVVNGYTRSVVIAGVNRDSSGNIVASGGSPDPSTKQVTVTVGWGTPISSNVSSLIYLTRYLDNLVYVQTLQAEFDAGTQIGTSTANSSGGEVILGAGGYGDWCRPGDFILGQLDLPKQGVADAIFAIEGRAFVGTGENASGVSFANVVITNTNPPTAAVSGTFDGYKTNGVFGEPDYAYLATDTNNKEVVIISLTQYSDPPINSKYLEIGSFNVPKEDNAKGVFVLANTGYVISGNYLYNFDLTSKTGVRPALDSDGVKLAGDATRVVVVGNYAYVTLKDSSLEMQVIDVSNPANLVIVGQTDLAGKNAKDIFVNSTSTRAYLATSKQENRPEFFIVDISTKTGNQPVISSYEAGTMSPKAVTVVTGNKAILVGKEGEEYQVIDIADELNPSRCGGLNIDDVKGINGVASVLESDGDAYSYIMTGDRDSEFKIIEGGPGGRYSTSGTFESSIYDTGYSTAFNYLSFTASTPPNTSLQLQIAGADPVSGSCSGAAYNYVGPDGTSNTFFSATGGPIPLQDDGSGYENPSRCLRYKAYLTTTDTFATPVLSDVTINYSP